MPARMAKLIAYTDGACSGNPGPGGWGVLMRAVEDGKIVKQRELKGGEELWQRLDAANARHSVTWEWVKGHAGHPENERADELARAGMAPFKGK